MSKTKRPLASQTSLALPSAQSTYRGGVYAERQKFGKEPKVLRALLGLRESDTGDAADVEVIGINPTLAEIRAFDALQRLLDRTDYRGNEQGKEVTSLQYRGDYLLPRLSFSWSEYFAAYGLALRSGRYQGMNRQEALAGLKSLAETSRLIVFKRRRIESKGSKERVVYDLIRQRGTIINILEGFRGLDAAVAARIEAGEHLPGRTTQVVVECGLIFVEGIETFFLHKSPSLYQEIQDYLGKRRFSPAVMLFCQWLCVWSQPAITIGKEKLAWELRLGWLVEQRKRRELTERLRQCCEVAKGIGYLLDYREDVTSERFSLTINPRVLRKSSASASSAGAAGAD
jgi:hypothetical protein